MNELKDKLSPRQFRKFVRLRREGAEVHAVGSAVEKVVVLPPFRQIAGHKKPMRSWCLS